MTCLIFLTTIGSIHYWCPNLGGERGSMKIRTKVNRGHALLGKVISKVKCKFLQSLYFLVTYLLKFTLFSKIISIWYTILGVECHRLPPRAFKKEGEIFRLFSNALLNWSTITHAMLVFTDNYLFSHSILPNLWFFNSLSILYMNSK